MITVVAETCRVLLTITIK